MSRSSAREAIDARASAWRWVVDGIDALVASREANAVLATLARMLVEHLADCCFVLMSRESAPELEVAISRDRNPMQQARATELAQRYPARKDAPVGAAVTVRTGRAELLPIVPDAKSTASADGAQEHPFVILRAFSMHSAMTIPLIAGADAIGAIVLTRSESKLPFNPDDVVAGELLARAAARQLAHLNVQPKPQDALDAAHMLGVASHEVMNCLGVLGMSAAILLRAAGSDPTVLAKHLNVIDRDTRRVARLNRELIDIARLHTGSLEVKGEWHDAAALLDETAESEKNDPPRGAIVVDANGPPLNVWVDRERILQVLSTLLAFAFAQASPPYSIILSAVGLADEVRIAVADTKTQLSDAMFSLLSDPLHCVAQTDHRELGLRLFISQAIVAAHDGRLSVERFEERGYKFSFTLPRCA